MLVCVIPIIWFWIKPPPTKFNAGGSKVVGVISAGADGLTGVLINLGSKVGYDTSGVEGL